MSYARASAVLWLIAACAQPKRETHWSPVYPNTTTTRSAPSPFLDVAGLSRVTVSTHENLEWGDGDSTQLDVLRAGKIVCELPFGGSWSAEGHSGQTSAELVLSSREPLRFHVRTRSISNVPAASDTCTGFELRDGATCRQLFEHLCSEDDCKLTYTTSVAPGTGTIRGTLMRDHEPFVGSSVMLESQLAITDEHGAFSINAGPGVHELAVGAELRVYASKASVSMSADQDADVSISIDCPCCTP